MYRRQHAQREAINLQNPQRIDIILVPLNESALGHGAILQRDQFA